jgi:ABC-2 type transport system ATP-binding protein
MEWFVMSDESLPVYLEGLQKIYYPDKVVLDNINLTVVEGETIGILGNNGAGKTTLIRILSSLLLPSYGIIEIFGLNPSFEATQIKQLIGYLPERFSFYPYFSVLEVLEFFSRLHDQNRIDQENLRERVIKSLDIDSYLHQQIRSLSKGMLHKVGLGVTLIHNPRLLVLDEPTSGLDPLARIQVRKFLLDLSDDFEKTVLISSHILEDIEAVCDRVFILEKGVMLHQPLWISELKDKFDQIRRVEIRGSFSNDSIHELDNIDDILYVQTSSRGFDLYCRQGYVSSLSSHFSDRPISDHEIITNPITLEDIYFLNHTKIEWMDFLS